MNRLAAKRAQAETETTRHCSYGEQGVGVVLHSAKHRNTVFLQGDDAENFREDWKAALSPEVRDMLVESYF